MLLPTPQFLMEALKLHVVFSAAMKPLFLLSLLAATSPLIRSQGQSQTLSRPEAAMVLAVDAGNSENLA